MNDTIERPQKIRIVGIIASGKTTLARRLSERLGIPWHELDSVVYRSEGTERYKRKPEEQRKLLEQIDRSGSWIFEGTDRSVHTFLYERADAIIFLDPPLWKRRMRIVSRWIKQRTGREECAYKPDLSILKLMFRWTRDFERDRPRFEAKLDSYGAKVLRITNTAEAERLLEIAWQPGPLHRTGKTIEKAGRK
ncbi:hypothetical protein QWJ34_22195 [Saccharibacillus sp. CPCC 101409]|uniref:hypothetical protein n=1 Tax=Saccharibacillus sp. CPCC 101409 TaxID=3058041 RepID=UPI0026717925|nr:hypothetical protein [Saccharibacillus sp. CPCC 101409]MDO3412492.1 hypothetical protein [Saccharibacillus sp. CPCC 101409]